MNMKCVDIHCLLTVHSIKKNKLDYYRGKDYVNRFCQDLKKQARSIIDFEKKEMNLTPEEEFSFYMTDKCYISTKPFYKDKNNNYVKVKDYCHYTGKNIEVLLIKYAILCIIQQEKYQLYFIMVLVMITILS